MRQITANGTVQTQCVGFTSCYLIKIQNFPLLSKLEYKKGKHCVSHIVSRRTPLNIQIVIIFSSAQEFIRSRFQFGWCLVILKLVVVELAWIDQLNIQQFNGSVGNELSPLFSRLLGLNSVTFITLSSLTIKLITQR